MTDAQKTLLYPFEAGELDVPVAGQRVLFLGAEPVLRLPDGFAGDLSLVQGFRPSFNGLKKAGHTVTPRPEGDGYDFALVLTGRHRGRNEAFVAEAVQRSKPGSTILVAGSKDDGIASLRKRLAESIEIEGSLPKHHGLAFWFRRPEAANPLTDKLAYVSQPVEDRFRTAPGMFSFDRVDAGSRLLVESFPASFKGTIGDFGAGWGYLSAEVLGRDGGIAALDLHDADYESVEAARQNISPPPHVETRFIWSDLLTEKPDRRYDAIVMNPPFHRGRAAEPDIGVGMIRAASAALKPGGRLYMAANFQLPYEATLSAAFADWSEVARSGGYKVIVARR